MFYASPNFCRFLSVMAQAVFFKKVDEGVERHCHNAQDDDGHEEPIHLEYLAGVDNKIPKPVPCRQKFPDDNSHKAQPDIDFHVADDGRQRVGEHHFDEGLQAAALQGVDELDFARVYGDETAVQA